MTAVQPFSYLTAQPAPLKPAFQRQDDLVETSVSSGSHSGELNAQEDANQICQSLLTVPYQLDSQRPQAGLGRAQTETTYDLRQHHYRQQQQQPEVAYNETRIKQPPYVAPKHTKDLDPGNSEDWGSAKEEGVSGVSKGALYCQTNPLAIDRLPDKTEPAKDPDFASGEADQLYGRPNRRPRGPETQDARKATPPPAQTQGVSGSDVPFSYTQPLGLSGAVTYGDMESRNGIGSKHYYSQSEQLGNARPRESPAVSAMEKQTIFENFILVGPERPQTREVAPKEPTKRLKLEELFDPPPMQASSSVTTAAAPVTPADPRKLSIHGVTNTESSDFHSTANYERPRDSDRSKTKTPVSTFDNPDYNFPGRAYTPPGPYTPPGSTLQGMSEDRPWSIGANNVLGSNSNSNPGKGTVSPTPRLPKAQGKDKKSNKMCVAVLITALIVSIVCLGAGFIAGWFGRGRALGY